MKYHCKRGITVEFYKTTSEELVVPLNLVKFIFCRRIETTLNYLRFHGWNPKSLLAPKQGMVMELLV